MYLAHIDTPTNTQNNYIKLPGFGFKKTRLKKLKLHQQNDEKHHLQ